MKRLSQDINTFPVGTYVDIPGVERMQNIKIEAINDSGVTVSGAEIGNYLVISGKSPAVRCEKQERVKFYKEEKQKPVEDNNVEVIIDKVEEITDEKILDIVEKVTKKSGYNEILAKMQVPGGDFTIKQIAELNELPIPCATTWVKLNCVEAGKAEKKEGQRGKSAMTYRFKI